MGDTMVERPLFFEDLSFGPPAVRGFLHRPGLPVADGLVLTHGAGSNSNAPLLVALAIAFAGQGLTVLRADLPFRQARPKGPPRPGGSALDREGLEHAVRAVRRIVPGRVFLGGHSYGGRQASMLAAAIPELAEALLLLSYPLHPPGRAAELRTAHFSKLQTPTLFVHGSEDPFGSIDEMQSARRLIPAPTELVVIEGARHDLDSGRRAPGIADRIVREFLGLRGSL